ncbi:hypothetical protein, partial [Neobacillus sp. 19]|uniref:hypothetical protein n=1 Tax=Neobacillus sp. 19 TaxID=3394458 RepID=UPI003BF64DBA
VLYFVRLLKPIFNPKPNNLDRRFRIYRETLSRFSCARLSQHGKANNDSGGSCRLPFHGMPEKATKESLVEYLAGQTYEGA